MKYDEIEKTKEFIEILPIAEEMTKTLLTKKGIYEDIPNYIIMYWNMKKKVLKENFNIDWHTPEELNPDVIFD